MERKSKIGVACAAGLVGALGCMLGIPLLAVAADGSESGDCVGGIEVADDGTPSILGPSTLTVADLHAWWNSSGRGQPRNLTLPVDRVIALYISEGEAEGVRGDYAFAQAVLETGYFTNRDTAINNFAGIAHYDGATSGIGFPDAVAGVRAHVQLLKKFAAGNGTPLARPDVSPNAGASATTWGGLAGTWATDTTYWTKLRDIYESMAGAAHGGAREATSELLPDACRPGPLLSGEYALPVDRVWYERNPEWFTKPHHDYPAADIPVPTGTPIYSASTGVVVATPTGGNCGIGVVVNGNDHAQYVYCHGLPGSHAVSIGESVAAGEQIMLSASTGNSTGPHLHFEIRVGGEQRCPQTFLVAVAEGTAIDLNALPGLGCSY